MSSEKEPPFYHQQIHADDSWRVFKIVSELVDGFETMTSLGPSVALFGSVRVDENNIYYKLCREVVKKIVQKGFGIITGGGPGLMEAANREAQASNGKSCGLCIALPTEEKPNNYIDSKFLLDHRYFFIRKVMFVRYAQAFVVMPGGYGTLDELFESLTLIQNQRIKRFPVYLMGKEYWGGLLDWLENTVERNGMISSSDYKLFTLTDDPDEVAAGIEEHYRKSLTLENF